MHIALYGRSFGVETQEKMRWLMASLSGESVQISCYRPLYDYLISHKIDPPSVSSFFSDYDDLPEDVELLLSLGGDGTFLSSLTIVRNREIPVAGINFGRLGFLTSVKCVEETEGVELYTDKYLKQILSGNFTTQKRTLLEVSLVGDDSLAERIYPYALNEISIKNLLPRMVGLDIKIDGKAIPTYWSDGLLIATATGSTAYSMSFGGPIATPDAGVFIITPMAPHNLNVRPLIVPDTSVIEVSLGSKSHSSLHLCADNRETLLTQGELLKISKAPFGIAYVSSGISNFIDALRDKLLWGEDKRVINRK